jgi:hypothetical protein
MYLRAQNGVAGPQTGPTKPPNISSDQIRATDQPARALWEDAWVGRLDHSPDTHSQELAAYAAGVDNWGAFDLFYLATKRPKDDQAAFYSAVDPRHSADVAFFYSQQVSFFSDAAKLIDKHPDWTLDDIVLELKQTALSGRTIDTTIVKYLMDHKITYSQLVERQNALDAALKKCMAAVDGIRPTQRPPSPSSACVRSIVSRGNPKALPSPTAIAAKAYSKPAEIKRPHDLDDVKRVPDAIWTFCVDGAGHPADLVMKQSTGFPAVDDSTRRHLESIWFFPKSGLLTSEKSCGFTQAYTFTQEKKSTR